MDLRLFAPDEADAVEQYVATSNAARAVDAPWMPPLTSHEVTGRFRFGWDLEPSAGALAVSDGQVVGAAAIGTSERDNLHLAWCDIEIHPEHRRRGHGSELVGLLTEHVRSRGRTSMGTNGWDCESTRAFGERQGFKVASVAVNRRQYLDRLDRDTLEDLYDQALTASSAYELVRLDGPVPEDELEAFAVMVSAINDAPTDDLDIEDEVFDAERIRAYEEAHRGREIALFRVYARQRDTGDLAGQTVVGVDLERPHFAEQHDTSVVGAHRGHRLGALLKLDMLRWLSEVQPQIESIDTWNAESNDHMIGVNQALGYEVMGRDLGLQRSLGDPH